MKILTERIDAKIFKEWNKKKSKYKNEETVIDGYIFDSKAEGNRYKELKFLENIGEISALKLQPKFLLQPAFRKNGKTFKKIEYIADFMYSQNGKIIIEDVKGMETKEFKIKRKLFEYKFLEYELKIIK